MSTRWLLLAAATISTAAGCATTKPTPPAPLPLEKAVEPVALLPSRVLKAIYPSNDRDWATDQVQLASAEFQGEAVTVRNIRHCVYRSAEDFTVRYYDKTFDLSKIERLDFIIVPFLETPELAHVEISFGFAGGDYLCVSVEIRREKGETYQPLMGSLRQFELMYVVADERDILRDSTENSFRGVYLYRARLTPAQVRTMFVDVMDRVNQLRDRPEFYNTLTNNCTTNVVGHLNRTGVAHIPFDRRVLVNGQFDRLAYDLGLIDTDLSFEETRLKARINRAAIRYADRADFSALIRR